MQTKPFGKLPEGKRLERVQSSPNYREGEFKNQIPTVLATGGTNRVKAFIDFIFLHIPELTPSAPLPSVKTDLNKLPKDRNWFVWFGHSSYLLNINGKTVLVDPVLVAGSPLSFINKMFEGSNVYPPSAMPEIDYMIITHDHWDHLDYEAVTQLQPKVKQVITSLGVGAHLAYWGYPENKIVELDWNEEITLENHLKLTALPARHFSGRGLAANQTLWSSFMLQSPTDNIYIGSDSGFDVQLYQNIAKRFPRINLALMENGQFDKNWAQIHIHPHELVQAIKILNPMKVVAVHNSKFALAKHSWKLPMERISQAAIQEKINLFTPKIGEVFYFTEDEQQFDHWWENIQ